MRRGPGANHLRGAWVLCLVCLARSGTAFGEDMSRLSIIPQSQRQMIKRAIAQKPGWAEDTYELDLMAEWDNRRLPIVIALPQKMLVPFSPKFAMLPSGRMVASHDPDGLSRIIDEVYFKAEAKDATSLAKLALWFGRFDVPVGTLLEHRPANAPAKLPRPDLEPKLAVAGAEKHVDFYAYNYDLRQMFDCRLRIAGKDVGITCKQLAGPEASGEPG